MGDMLLENIEEIDVGLDVPRWIIDKSLGIQIELAVEDDRLPMQATSPIRWIKLCITQALLNGYSSVATNVDG